MATCGGWSDMASEENLSSKNPDNLGKWGAGVIRTFLSRPLPEVVSSLKALRSTSDARISFVSLKSAVDFLQKLEHPLHSTEPGLRKARLVVHEVFTVTMWEIDGNSLVSRSSSFQTLRISPCRDYGVLRQRPTKRKALRSPSAPDLPEGAKWTRARAFYMLLGAGSNVRYEFPTPRRVTLFEATNIRQQDSSIQSATRMQIIIQANS